MPGPGVRSVGRGNVRLHVTRFGGDGPPVVFLHGLAGFSGEWEAVAGAVMPEVGTFAFDARGHGRSTRRPADVSREAFVSDVVQVIHEVCDGGPVHLAGQSMGGHTAMLVAAHHPDLVQSLILMEASPGGPCPTVVDEVRQWFAGWPTPFTSRDEAVAFFGGPGRGDAWFAGLERRADGWWPRFDSGVLLSVIEPVARRSWWREWERVRCPTLLLLAERSSVQDTEVERMRKCGPPLTVRFVAGTGHDLHLDNPAGVGRALRSWFETGG